MAIDINKLKQFGKALVNNEYGSIIHTTGGNFTIDFKDITPEVESLIQNAIIGVIGPYAIDIEKVVCIERRDRPKPDLKVGKGGAIEGKGNDSAGKGSVKGS